MIIGTDAASLTRSIEREVITGGLAPGAALPSIRALAGHLGLSPTTVAAAYRELRQRGVLVSHDRSRTVVAHRPPLAVRLGPQSAAGLVDLASGNPDPALLPGLAAPWSHVTPTHRLYGTDVCNPALLEAARADLAPDGVPTDRLAVVGGGLDGLERVLAVHGRPGDRVAVEDPAYIGALDLIRSIGLVPAPVETDDAGMLPDRLTAVLEQGATTVLLVPRAQNPTGAALTAARAVALRDVLTRHPRVLVVEDDPAGPISGAAYHRVVADHPRWATIRSLTKTLGPDLRVAILAADEETSARVLGRQRLGTGWVSHLLQEVTAAVWTAARTDGTLDRAAATYGERREALAGDLRRHGLDVHGASGLNVWLRVPEEVPVVQGLASRGWGVQAGEPYRFTSRPAIRITTARLAVEDAPALVSDILDVLDQRLGTRRG